MKAACGAPWGPPKCLFFFLFVSSLLLFCPFQVYGHRLLTRSSPLTPSDPPAAPEAAATSGTSASTGVAEGSEHHQHQQQQKQQHHHHQQQQQLSSPISIHSEGSSSGGNASASSPRDERGSRERKPHHDHHAAATAAATAAKEATAATETSENSLHDRPDMSAQSPLGLDASEQQTTAPTGENNREVGGGGPSVQSGGSSQQKRGPPSHKGGPHLKSPAAADTHAKKGIPQAPKSGSGSGSGSGVGSRGSQRIFGRQTQGNVRGASQEETAEKGQQQQESQAASTPAVSSPASGDDSGGHREPQEVEEGAPPLGRETGSSGGSDPIKGPWKVLEPDAVPTVEEQLEAFNAAGGATGAGGGAASGDPPQSVMKPPLDNSEYASFRVEDLGLSGFAGVDLSQEIGAFAVSVGCGYFNDPRGLPGLAHALEHAIFLGSSMQPDLKGWDEFISSRGGTHNAHTKPDTTTFYVSAPSKHLAELFSVFLDHIFHPLLLTQQMQSEVMAVQSEHDKNTPDLERVALHLALQYLPDSGTEGTGGSGGDSDGDSAGDTCVSPVSGKFGTGNLETLCERPRREGIDVLASMRRLHSKCYVPENMAISFRMGRIEGDSQPQQQYGLWEVIELISAAVRERASSASPEAPGASLLQRQTVSQKEETHKEGPSEARTSTSTPAGAHQTLREGDNPQAASRDPTRDTAEDDGGEKELPEGIILSLKRDHGWRRRLFVFWSAPADLEANLVDLQCQPSSLLQYLLEHPVKGGLLQLLKEKGYISRGEAFTHMTLRSSIVGLSLELTEEGESNADALLGLVREFVLKVTEAVAKDSFILDHFDVYGKLSGLLWSASDPLGPLDQVVATAETTLQFPSRPDLALGSGFCLSPPPKETLLTEVRRLARALISSKHVVVQVFANEKGEASGSLKELNEYGVKYSVSTLPWEQGASGDTSEGPHKGPHPIVPSPLSCRVTQGPVVKHPIPDVCQATGARLPTLASEEETGQQEQEQQQQRGLAPPPCVLLSSDSTTILWHNGEPFNKPIVRFFARARVSSSVSTALHDALGKIFTLILAEKAKLHLAKYHGCGVDLVIAYTGASLIFELQTLSSLFEEVTEGLGLIFKQTVAEITEEEFDKTVAQLLETTRDFSGSTAYELALDVALSLLREYRFSQFDMQEQLHSPELNFEAFQKFVSGALLRTAVDCLLMGDIAPSKATTVALKFVDSIRSQPLPYEEAASSKTLNLVRDVEVSLQNPIPGDVNSAFVSLYVSEPPDVLESVIYSTVGEMIRAPFFDTLRTVNMDGYVASAGVTELPPVSALSTIVQSSVRTPAELEEHVCGFLHLMGGLLAGALSPAAFKSKMKWEGRSHLEREQATFGDFFSGAVAQVSTRSFCFIKSQLAAAASQHFMQCPESLGRYFNKLVFGPSRQRITVKIEAATREESVSSPTGQSECIFLGSNSVAGALEGPRGPQSPVAEGPLEQPGKQRLGPLVESLQPRRPTTELTEDAGDGRAPGEGPAPTGATESPKSPEKGLATSQEGEETGDTSSHGLQRPGDSHIVTVGLSADADMLPASARRSQNEEEQALQKCSRSDSNASGGTVRLTKFAEHPQEERQRLLQALSETLEGQRDDSSGVDPVSLWTEFVFAKHCTIREETIKTTATCEANSKLLVNQIAQEGAGWGQIPSTGSAPNAGSVSPNTSADTEDLAAPPAAAAPVAPSAATAPSLPTSLASPLPTASPVAAPLPAATPPTAPPAAAAPPASAPAAVPPAGVTPAAVTPASTARDGAGLDAASGQSQPVGTSLQLQAQVAEQQQQLLLLHELQQQQAAAQKQIAAEPRPTKDGSFLAPQASTQMPLGTVQQQEQEQQRQQQQQQEVQQQVQTELAAAEKQLSALHAAWVSLQQQQQQQQQQLMQPRVALLRRYGSVPAVVFGSGANAAIQHHVPRLLEGAVLLPGVGQHAPRRLVFPSLQQFQSLQMRREVIEQQIAQLQRRLLLQDSTAAAAATAAKAEVSTQL